MKLKQFLVMKIKSIIFYFVVTNIAFLQTDQDSLNVKDNVSTNPLIISTIPFINTDPFNAFYITTLNMIAMNIDTTNNEIHDPKKALFLSSIPLLNLASSNEALYIPSLGQMYNNKVLKSFILSALKSYWLLEYKETKDTNIKDRNRSLWWLLLLMLYSMGDAYVDANLIKSMNEMDLDSLININGDIK